MNDAQIPSPPPTAPAAQPQRRKFNFWRWFWIGSIPVWFVWVWYDFYVPANHVTWAKDYASAQQHAVQSGKPTILFFTGKWCVPCRIMKRNVWADPQVEVAVTGGFTPVMIDVDDPNAAETVRRYGAGATPTTIIIDPKGSVLERVVGGMGKAAFLELLGRRNPSAAPLAP